MRQKDQLSHFRKLKKKWLRKSRRIEKKIIGKHGHLLATLIPRQHIIGGIMAATIPFMSVIPGIVHSQTNKGQQEISHLSASRLISKLKEFLPKDIIPLTQDQENKIASLLSESFNVNVASELQGIRLNRSYGLIGQEQHLKRYPGDTTEQHLLDSDEKYEFLHSKGIAPGLGAWGYFAQSRAEITFLDNLREKYYIAVPTFLAPGWQENVGKFGLFLKYRKMLVVNPENGKAVIADIADAGPAEFTGKHLGGSPEIMNYLEREDGARRGPVLYFFVDDPNDTIALGPIKL